MSNAAGIEPGLRRARGSGGPDLLVVGHGLAERDDQDRAVLAVREVRADRAGEERADENETRGDCSECEIVPEEINSWRLGRREDYRDYIESIRLILEFEEL